MKKKEVIVCILALVVLIFSATNVLAAPMNMDTDDEQPSILDENDVNNNITNEQEIKQEIEFKMLKMKMY